MLVCYKSIDNVKAGSVIKSFKKCGISNVMDGSVDNLLYESKDEAEVDLPEPEWNPYDDGICNESHDVFKKLFETDSDDGDEFDGF